MKKTTSLVLTALFTALIAVGAFIKIPIPNVPITFQLFFVLLGGVLLGGKLGFLSALIYMVLGLVGIPIFTGGGGFGYVFQPTFGYIIGFCFGALAAGLIAHKVPNPSYKRLLLANFCGLIIIYIFGIIYYWVVKKFYVGEGVGFYTLMLYCFLLPVPGDIILCFLNALVGKRLIPVIKKRASN